MRFRPARGAYARAAVTTTCPHGFAATSCEICRVLGTGPAGPATPAERQRQSTGPERWSPARWPGGVGLGLVGAGIAVVVAVVVVTQVLAAAWALFRLLQLVVVAAVSGWLGYRLGLVAGRRR